MPLSGIGPLSLSTIIIVQKRRSEAFSSSEELNVPEMAALANAANEAKTLYDSNQDSISFDHMQMNP